MAIESLAGLTGTNMITQSVTLQYEDSKAESFQAVLDKAVNEGDDEELKNATKAYEAYFINMLFKQMRNTVSYAGGLFERSAAEKMFQEMLDEEYANQAAENGSFGLAKAMYEQMKHS